MHMVEYSSGRALSVLHLLLQVVIVIVFELIEAVLLVCCRFHDHTSHVGPLQDAANGSR